MKKNKFKSGDVIQDKHGVIYTYGYQNDDYHSVTEYVHKDFLSTCTFYTPKFKVGDIIQFKNKGKFKIRNITTREYQVDTLCNQPAGIIHLTDDIFCTLYKEETDLKPFDKVLVRNDNDENWKIELFQHEENGYYYCLMGWYTQCIPYKGNEHLLKI